MSKIIEIARDLMAVMRETTGTGSTGTVTVTASGADVDVGIGRYAVPIVNGVYRDDLVMKVDEGPNEDKSWTVTSSGVDVDFLSNLGGERHNIEDGTVLVFDPPVDGISTLVANGDFTGGVNGSGPGTVEDIVMYDQLFGAEAHTDINRSKLKGIPGVVITWQNTTFGDLLVRSKIQNIEHYTISVITRRTESDHARREEGQIILDDIAGLILDRKEVDGYTFSGPNGVMLEGRDRETGVHKNYQQFYIYYITVGVTSVLSQCDSRSYEDWDITNLVVEKPQDPALPNQGDYELVNTSLIMDDSDDSFVVDDVTQEPVVDDEDGSFIVEDD